MSGTGGRRIRPGLGTLATATAALPPFTAALALELAPVRVNLIAAGFVDAPLSASLLGGGCRPGVSSCARPSRSAAWSDQPTSPRSPFTS
jgi:NAD(P)-dependent dehydrogenase (short-subunit alcohol dehydrogenase family)